MGKGLIVGNLGEGLYSVTLDKNVARLVSEITVINEKISEVFALIASAQAEIEAEYEADYQDPSPDPDPDEPPPDDLPAGDAGQGGNVT